MTLVSTTSKAAPVLALARPTIRGKFLAAGGSKLYVRGVTYGAFEPDAAGREYTDLATVERDFAQMAAAGLNAVRIPHTVPPRALLDVALRHGLRVMVGLSAEQYVGYLLDGRQARAFTHEIRDKARSVKGHPALLCYGLGNEIAAPVARWLGRSRIERYLREAYEVVKAEDPEGLVTYVNYPSTEYLDLPFLDLVAFNVYLESPERFESYLYRLQNLAGDRPLIMSELGLDSLRHGAEAQARALDWQIRATASTGCAGAFVFAWTDEWFRGGAAVEDWDFGVTRRDRSPKPALESARRAFAAVPYPVDRDWPRVSVVVCSYNGSRTIRDCLEGLRQVEYPDFEVIVVDDGSTDATSAIAHEYDVRVIRTENQGLSRARTTGMSAATGEIVAYIDDDARPDRHWLQYLAATFTSTDHVAVGGPNIAPRGDGPIAECVANAPGGPLHVLVTDRVAEHIPGCNMAFRKHALEAIGGFDPRFRVAGDDVDACWRLTERGGTIGFSPGAMVWHHRRNSVRTYWKQQMGYGKAEALLEAKWPERYNAMGHVSWEGRIYGNGLTQALEWGRGRIYHGQWGSAPYQFLERPAPGLVASLPLMPEWWLVVGALAGIAALGLAWPPLLLALPLVLLAVSAPVAQAIASAARARFPGHPPADAARLRALTALLHLMQPVARLRGRLRWGLTPWRRRGRPGFIAPWPHSTARWTEDWVAPDERLHAVDRELREDGWVVRHGGDHDRWDLEVRGGALGCARFLMAVEDHGSGTQHVRARTWPRVSRAALAVALVLAALAVAAGVSGAWLAGASLGLAAAAVIGRVVLECGSAAAAIVAAQPGVARRED